jgi:hypothetical protein
MDFEQYIHDNINSFGNCYRENEIKKLLNDPSINGVDHYLVCEDKHIFIQDKWKIHVSQHEVSQFLDCVSRIICRLKLDNVYMIFVSKTKPTKFAVKSLEDKNAILLVNDSWNEILAKLVEQINRISSIGKIKCTVENIGQIEDIRRCVENNKYLLGLFKECLNIDKKEFNIAKFEKLNQLK